MQQDDAQALLVRLAERYEIKLNELPPSVMPFLRELAEGYLDGKRMATSLLHSGERR
jgi:hypothetical protein